MRETISLPSLVHGVSQLNPAERAPVHALSCINTWPSVPHGDQKRPPLQHVAKIKTGDFGATSVLSHKVDRGPDEQYIAIFKNFSDAGSGAGAGLICDLAGVVYPIKDAALVYPSNDSLFGYLSLNAADVAAGLLLKSGENIRALTSFDSTYILNRRRMPARDTGIFAPAKPKGHAYVFIHAGSYGLKYSIKFKIGVTTYTVNAHTGPAVGTAPANMATTLDGVQVWDYSLCNYPNNQLAAGAAGTPTISAKTEDIAQNLTDKLNAATFMLPFPASAGGGLASPSPVTATRFGSVIKIQVNAANTDFASFEVTTSQGEGLAFGIWNEVSSINSLPKQCTDGYVVRVRGAISGPQDDFYMKFVAQVSGAFGQGEWEETVAWGNAIALQSLTTPHRLTRQTDDGSGTATGSANSKYFTFDEVTWDRMLVGDDESNPLPTPFGTGRHFLDVVRANDRLCWLTEDGVLASEQGEDLNYYRTTVRELPAADPIDVFVKAENARLHSAVEINGNLILFSQAAQYVFRGQPLLTPSSVEAKQVSRYTSTLSARPVAFEDGIVFGSDQGTFVGLRNLVQAGNVEDTFRAADLSIHVPSYVTGPLRQIEVSTDAMVIAVLGAALDTIYILKQHREGDEIKQSAWVSFVLEDAEVLGVHFFGSKLYVVSQRTEGVFLEYLDLSAGVSDGGRNFWLYLDRRVTTPSFSVALGVTTVTLPYDIETGADLQVVRFPGAPGTMYTAFNGTQTGARTFTVPTDLTGYTFVAGRAYTSVHGFHKPQVMLNSQTGRKIVLDEESSVLQLNLKYANTSYLEIQVGSDLTTVGNPTVGFEGLIDPLDGKTSAGVDERLEADWAVSVSNPSPFPHTLVSAEWVVNAVIRSPALG